MNKFFVVSDLHSFFTPFKKALDEAGFDENNENHWLIVCGDAFDRGLESKKLLKYLIGLERKILIRGNHDLLFEELCAREYAYMVDKQNGTLQTVIDLGTYKISQPLSECCQIAWQKTAVYRKLLVNYFETENYIFVHSWLPIKVKYNTKLIPNKSYVFRDDWREASDDDWEEAMWCNPFNMADLGLNQTGKTVVFGHFSTNQQWDKKLNASDAEKANFVPYIGDNYIGIDGCVAKTGKVNVIVLEDNFI